MPRMDDGGSIEVWIFELEPGEETAPTVTFFEESSSVTFTLDTYHLADVDDEAKGAFIKRALKLLIEHGAGWLDEWDRINPKG